MAGSSSPPAIIRNQNRSTSAICRTSPRTLNTDGSTDLLRPRSAPEPPVIAGPPAAEVAADPIEIGDDPLLAPVTREMSWANVHGLAQTPLRAGAPAAEVAAVTAMRRTAGIRRG